MSFITKLFTPSKPAPIVVPEYKPPTDNTAAKDAAAAEARARAKAMSGRDSTLVTGAGGVDETGTKKTLLGS